MPDASPPLNIAQLNERLTQVATDLGIPVARARVMLCTLVVSQMLPKTVVVKGGMGVKLRLGETGTRATQDFDVSTTNRGEAFEQDFSDRLALGWGRIPPSKGALKRDPDAPERVAFTATLRTKAPHDPGLAHPQYVMHPYRVNIAFLGTPWGGLDVEVSDSEVDGHAHAPHAVDNELRRFGARFGFGRLRPIELISLEYQIAQKLHAVTDPAYVRPHDLVDLQLLWEVGPDLPALRNFCVRTFTWRSEQAWPPVPLRSMDSWGPAYADARHETEVTGQTHILPNIESARRWVESIVTTIENSHPGAPS